MKRWIWQFVRHRGGASAIEYAVIGMLIALALISGATLIGKSLSNDLMNANNGFSTAS